MLSVKRLQIKDLRVVPVRPLRQTERKALSAATAGNSKPHPLYHMDMICQDLLANYLQVDGLFFCRCGRAVEKCGN